MGEELNKEKEEQIILAARRVFARYGYSKTTMEDISSEVEMGKASLYYYFPNKESLFQAAVLHEQDEFLKKAASLLNKTHSSEKKLKAYVEERLKFFRELVNLGTLSYKALNGRHSVNLRIHKEFSEKEVAIINQIIDEGKASGEFTTDVPGYYAELLIHLLHGLRLRSTQSITGSENDNKIYKDLRNEMNMTIDLFIKAIHNSKESNKE